MHAFLMGSDKAMRRTRYGGAALILASCAFASGCSGPTTGTSAPRQAAAQAATTLVVRTAHAPAADEARLSSYAGGQAVEVAVVAAPGLQSPATPHVAGDAIERELGTASDGGYQAYSSN